MYIYIYVYINVGIYKLHTCPKSKLDRTCIIKYQTLKYLLIIKNKIGVLLHRSLELKTVTNNYITSVASLS